MKKDTGNAGHKGIWAAFTLIELMIVVAIIGILAAIALPNYSKFMCRTKQSEAKTVLKGIRIAQEAYRTEADSYTDNPAAYTVWEGGVQRYEYDIDLAGDGSTFTATATGKPAEDVVGDLWHMNALGTLTAVSVSSNCQ